MTKKLLIVFLFILVKSYAQETPISIEEQTTRNRVALYAVNESETSYDAIITIEGTNFKQSKGKPRLIRIPAASKVQVQNLIMIDGKKPVYTYDIVLNDSLSRRAQIRPAEAIKIDPRKSITLYITEACSSCDSISNKLTKSYYKYTSHTLADVPEMKEQLKAAFANSVVKLDSLHTPVINLGGVLHTEIETYEQLLEAIKEE